MQGSEVSIAEQYADFRGRILQRPYPVHGSSRPGVECQVERACFLYKSDKPIVCDRRAPGLGDSQVNPSIASEKNEMFRYLRVQGEYPGVIVRERRTPLGRNPTRPTPVRSRVWGHSNSLFLFSMPSTSTRGNVSTLARVQGTSGAKLGLSFLYRKRAGSF